MVEAVGHTDTFPRSYSGRCGISSHPIGVWSKYCSLLAIVGCIQNWLQVLTKTFCKVEALIDDEGNVLIDQNGDPELKVPISESNSSTPAWWHSMLCIVHP